MGNLIRAAFGDGQEQVAALEALGGGLAEAEAFDILVSHLGDEVRRLDELCPGTEHAVLRRLLTDRDGAETLWQDYCGAVMVAADDAVSAVLMAFAAGGEGSHGG